MSRTQVGWVAIGGDIAETAVWTYRRLVTPGVAMSRSLGLGGYPRGSGIGFEDRGGHELKGVPGEWRLYAVSAG